ncbi:hypothetical protein SERLA73DRAFT_66072, partial [Serpula lacrymans var. lacrymans S7.3]
AYIGDDYPITFPVRELDTVALTLQESVHFTLNSTYSLLDKEWTTLTTHPQGLGRVHMGPDYRIFALVFSHQLHCIREMERAFMHRDHSIPTSGHFRHCLNYLRQSFLCDATDSLEKGDFLKRDFNADRLGDTLICRDWEKVYSKMSDQFSQWLRWKKGHGKL